MNESVIAATPSPQRTRAWIAVGALGISAFAIVTSELAPVGMLTALAQDLGQTEAGAGLVVTAYAWVAALAALLSALMPARVPRKPLLAGLMLVLAASAVTSSLSASFSLLLTARMAGALAHGAFWAMIGTVAAQLVPAARLGLATAVIFGGVSAASVLSVPLTHAIAHLSGWRTVFQVIAALSLFTACGLIWTLPSLNAAPPVSATLFNAVLRNPVMLRLYLVTACVITAHFAAFTYLEPLLTRALSVPAAAVMSLLLVFGVAGLLGNVIAGKCLDRHLKMTVALALLLSALALAALMLMMTGSPHLLMAAALLALWSASMAVIFVGLQTWVLRVAGDAALPASALYVAIFNAAIGCGALAGGLLLRASGLQGVMLAAAATVLAGAAGVITLRRQAL